MKKNIHLLFLFLVTAFFLNQNSNAQCISGSAGGNPNLSDDGGGSYSIACDGGDVNLTATSPITAASNIQWTSGQTGNFTFSPDCSNLGCQEFTPCVPAGTNIAQQCISLGNLTDTNGNPVALSGNVPAGGSTNVEFVIEDICYVPGMTYSGALGIQLSGSGDVSLSVVQPDGAVQGPLTFAIDLINGLSPIDLTLLGLNVDPNGTWSISLSDAGAGSFGYTINNSQTSICLEPITTAGPVCGDPIEICVFGGCPSFVSAEASVTEVCAENAVFTLGATLDPLDAPNVTYMWSGNGVPPAQQNSPNPTVSTDNTTCAPIVEDYTLTITCTNDGSTVVTNEIVSVTIYPEIDLGAIVIDNTTNVTDPNCSIDVTAPCGFAVSGPTTFSPGDNGTTAEYIISNGNTDCDVTVSALVNCLGDCTPADATVTTTCDGNGNYTVDVTVNSLGDSQAANIELSDGSMASITGANTTYNFGPYPSGSPVNIKILDPNDPSCSLNLGEYDGDCFTCPNLTSLGGAPTDVCSGDIVILVANVDMGTEGVDYAIQWFEDGVAINGGNTATYPHTTVATDRCNAAVHTYSATLTCLNGGAEPTTTMLSGGPVNVYPIPEEGIDFVFENCSVTPIDNCGTLTIDLGGATDPAVGGATTVNYTITVGSAPASCAATGTATVSCPDCPDYPGNGTATETVVCHDEVVDFSNTAALVTSLGYEVGFVVTPDPPSTYPNTAALIAADISGNPRGPFSAPGSIPATTFGAENVGPITDPCGELFYFTPFLSFACQSYTAENSSGTVETPAGSDFIAGVYQTPGIGGVTLAVPQVPYCSGLVTYNIELCVDDETNDGAGLFGLCTAGEDPLQESSLFNLIDGLPGGGFSNFPNIDDIHDSQQNVCYNQNGWSVNPSGELINLVTVNLQDFCLGGNDNDFMDWDFQVDVICNSNFPTICPDCDVVGAPVAVRFLPEITLDVIVAPASICDGESIDLYALNPATNLAVNGTYTWFEGPAINAVTIADPTALVPPVGTTQYCVSYAFCETGDCITETCVDITVDPLPVLTAPVLGPICQGESFDLTSVEGDVTVSAGAIQWTVGSAEGASIADPTAVTPVASEQYCAIFTDGTTGCSNSICTSFTYTPLPILLAAAPEICADSTLELTDINMILSTDPGVFVWYDADPATGATALANTAISGITDGTEYWVTFTDNMTGCSTTTSIVVSVNPLPVLLTPMAEVCEGDSLILADLNPSVTTDAGTFTWYEGDPATGTEIVDPVMPLLTMAATMYCVVFTEDANGCSNSVCFTPTINALPIFTDYAPPAECADSGPFDLTAYEDLLSSADFEWSTLDDMGNSVLIPDPTMVNVDNGTTATFDFTLTDPLTGCIEVSSIELQVYNPVDSATVMFDCGTGLLSIDLSTAVGGSGSGYIVAADSPNMDGDVLADGDTYTVYIEDGIGCRDTITTLIECCQATAPTVSVTGPDCGDGSIGAPITLVDNMDGSTNAGELTEYILTTAPNDTIRLVGDFADMEAAIAGVGEDSTVCIQAITYIQAQLDSIVVGLNDCTGGLAVTALGLSLSGNTLEGIITAIQTSAVGAGATFTIGDIEGLIGGGGGGPGMGGSVDVGALLGLGAGLLVCDVDPFCYSISMQTCITVGSCGCNAAAPTVSLIGTDCGDGSFDGPFDLVDNADGSTGAGEITEYILTTAPNDTIRLVGDEATIEATLDGLPADSTVCVQTITHIQAELDSIVVDLNDCTGGLLVNALGLSLSGNTLEGIITAIQTSPLGAGATFTIGDIETLIGGGNGGPGAGGMVDLGALLGLAPGALVCDVPPFCYSIGDQACITTGECGMVCPLITAVTPPTAVCSGSMANVCVDFDMPVDATISAIVNGVSADGSAGGTQICVMVPVDANNGCAVTTFEFITQEDCDGTIIPFDTFAPITTNVYPGQPTADVTAAATACSAETGVVSVNILAADGVTVCGTGVRSYDAAANNTCGPITEDFVDTYAIADIETLLGTPAGSTCYTDIAISESVLVYPAQPTANAIVNNFDACSGETAVVTISLIAADGVTVCDGPLNIDAPTNTTCGVNNEMIQYTYADTDIEVLLGGGVGCYIDATVDAIVNVHPEYTITVVPPACDGATAGSATLSVNGVACETTLGTSGMMNVCPSTTDTDATLTYDFTAAIGDAPVSCVTGTVTDAISTDCSQPCDCPADPDLQIDATELCGSGSVTLTAAFLGGTGTGTLTITESTGAITGIMSGTAIVLPANVSCNPITYTFDVTAVCSDGSTIPAGNGTTQVSATVYPTYSLVVDGASACGDTHLDVVSADNTVCMDNVATASCTTPVNCTDLAATDMANYTNTFFAGTTCEQTLNMDVSCSCDAPPCVCPTDPSIAADISEGCGSGTATITGSFGTGSGGTFAITESTGAITGIMSGTAFALPTNNSCNPITYTFTATVTCDSDMSNIAETTAGDLTTTITVYPTYSLVVDGVSACGDTHLDVVSADNTVCMDNVATASCVAPVNCTDPAATDMANYTNTFFAGTTCEQTLNMDVSCSCDAPPCNCPTDPVLSADVTEACGSGSVTLSTAFGGGTGTGMFSIMGDNGIGSVTAGTAITLPVNNSCDPITYNFTANATCDDDGSAVAEANAGDLTVSVVVYPTLTVVENGASTCGPVAELQSADGSICATEGTAVGFCASDLMYDFTDDITYTAPASCPLPANLTGTVICDCFCDGSITGVVTVDDNCDGTAGEIPTMPLTVTLTDPNGVMTTTTTDGTGAYSFAGLECGPHDVTVDVSAYPCEQFASNNPRTGILIDDMDVLLENFDFSQCDAPADGGSIEIARVCKGNDLYVIDPNTMLPYVATDNVTMEWFLDGVSVASLTGASYFAPTQTGTYTVIVTDLDLCIQYTSAADGSGDFEVNEIIDCRNCGK